MKRANDFVMTTENEIYLYKKKYDKGKKQKWDKWNNTGLEYLISIIKTPIDLTAIPTKGLKLNQIHKNFEVKSRIIPLKKQKSGHAIKREGCLLILLTDVINCFYCEYFYVYKVQWFSGDHLWLFLISVLIV